MSDRAQSRCEFPAKGQKLVWLSAAATVVVSLAIVAVELSRAPGIPHLSALAGDAWLFALALAVGLLASALAVGAADRAVRPNRAAGAALALAAGLVLGLAKAGSFAFANRYLSLGMVRLAVANAAAIVSALCLAALLIFACAVAVPALLPPATRRGRGRRLIAGALPALAIFVFVGYHLNRMYLPGLREPLSLVGNALWLALCAAALWPLGWLSQRLGALAARLSSALVAATAALVAIALGLAALALAALAPERPNLILISIDTLRADHLGSYGYRRPTSPNIDAFAADAVLFRNAIAQAPWTLPSHMSIFTGLYPSTHGAMTKLCKLSPRFVTLGEILQQEAYTSVAFTDGIYLSYKYGHQGFNALEESRGTLKGVRLADKIVDNGVAFLRRPRLSRPFFLFLHTYQVHCPYDPPAEWDRFTDPAYAGALDTAEMCEDDYESIKPSMNAADYEHVVDKYDGEIAFTDAQLGRLFAELKAQGLYEDSVIVLTSDHGENFSDHPEYELGHGTLYDHTLHVPLIVKAPGLPAGAVVEATVESVDILPTVLDLLDIELPERVDGTTLRPTIATGARERPFAHSEVVSADLAVPPGAGMATRMVRSADWKLICSATNRCALYDLAADPGEQQDLFEVRPDVAHELRGYLGGWAAEQDRRLEAVDSTPVELDDDLMRQLRALGYVQ